MLLDWVTATYVLLDPVAHFEYLCSELLSFVSLMFNLRVARNIATAIIHCKLD
jgi:hypothetical protein